ncbi:uncharacterized protein LOC122665759 [Telopea speciosissima]|uniref:uncharacterized protein LOC122665759 n=1 Tax=Telopea speciosissima TaxID=54955 RepID=UPI001CC7A8CE|nr:uncharacterized protein LOC122665759 [Telopea speciosissima]
MSVIKIGLVPCPRPTLGGRKDQSYTNVVARSLAPQPTLVELKKPASYFGEPAVFFSVEEVELSEIPFSTTLVAKCSYGRPSLSDVKEFLKKTFFLQGDVIVSSWDKRHLLFKFSNHSDFVRVWLKEQIHVRGFLLRFLKWSSGFMAGWESPVVPIWVSLPGLPINFYQGNFLSSIAGTIGKALRVDSATINCTRTVAARVCVEIDLRKSLPDRVWIGYGSGGFYQKVLYERLPSYCTHCSKLGHAVSDCRKAEKFRAPKLRGDVVEAAVNGKEVVHVCGDDGGLIMESDLASKAIMEEGGGAELGEGCAAFEMPHVPLHGAVPEVGGSSLERGFVGDGRWKPARGGGSHSNLLVSEGNIGDLVPIQQVPSETVEEDRAVRPDDARAVHEGVSLAVGEWSEGIQRNMEPLGGLLISQEQGVYNVVNAASGGAKDDMCLLDSSLREGSLESLKEFGNGLKERVADTVLLVQEERSTKVVEELEGDTGVKERVLQVEETAAWRCSSRPKGPSLKLREASSR